MVDQDLFEAVAILAQQDPTFRAALTPRTRDELHRYIEIEYGYTLPRQAVCDGHCSPFDALADAFLGQVLDAIWVGPRTGGKTLQFALLDHLMMKHYATTIANVGAIEEQAKKCYEYVRGFVNLPQFKGDTQGESLMSVTTLRNGGKVEILPATLNRVNSPHPERAHWDEIELTDWSIIQEGLSFCKDTQILTINGYKPIQEITVDDTIFSLYEGKISSRPVAWAGCTGAGKTKRIHLSNGRSFAATASHEVLTPSGWRTVEALAVGDRLVSGVRGRHVRQKDAVLSPAQADERPSAKTQRVSDMRQAKVGGFEDVSILLHHRSQSNADTEGRNPLSALSMFAMRQSVQRAGRDMRDLSPSGLARSHARAARIGAGEGGAISLDNGTWEQARRGVLDRFARSRVSSENSSPYRSVFDRLFTRGNANRHRGSWSFSPHSFEGYAGRCKRDMASSEGLSSCHLMGCSEALLGDDAYESVRVIGVTDGPSGPVYDIGVEQAHNFVAEGVVVHNSMPVRTNGRPPATIYTSSRKKAYGPMEKLLEEARERNLRTYFWCMVGDTLVSTEYGQREIRKIHPGERVWSRASDRSFVLRPVTFAACTGRKATIFIVFDDGRRIQCTDDHEFLTEEGWKAAGLLKPGDVALSGVQKGRYTLSHATEEVDVCMRSGKIRPLHDMRRVSSQANVTDECCEGCRYGNFTSKEEISLNAVKAGSGGSKTIRSSWHSSRNANSYRIVNGRLSTSSDFDSNRDTRMASRTVKRRRARYQEARKAFANGFSSNYSMVLRNGSMGSPIAGSVRVASVDLGPTEDVYDITVSETHNFLANGIVVHNCVFEIMETCPPERHQNGGPKGCGACPLQEVCREKNSDEFGNETYRPGPGKAARSRGWYRIDDVIQKFIRMDRSVWDSQWMSLRPDLSGLAYPMFNERIHVIDYDYNPSYPVVCGTDHGYTNPSVALYAQATPSDDIILFAEDYVGMRTADVMAESMLREPWFGNTYWRVSDSAAKGDRETLIKYGVYNEPSDKTSEVQGLPNLLGGIALVRWMLKPSGRNRPILYIARRCKQTIREMKKYHHPDPKEDRNAEERPVKSDDHAMDALRYLAVRLYAGQLEV